MSNKPLNSAKDAMDGIEPNSINQDHLNKENQQSTDEDAIEMMQTIRSHEDIEPDDPELD